MDARVLNGSGTITEDLSRTERSAFVLVVKRSMYLIARSLLKTPGVIAVHLEGFNHFVNPHLSTPMANHPSPCLILFLLMENLNCSPRFPLVAELELGFNLYSRGVVEAARLCFQWVAQKMGLNRWTIFESDWYET